MKDCIFCKIIAGEIPSHKIYENKHVYAFLDIANDFYGHTLVIPKKHSCNVLEINGEDYANLMMAVKLISEHYVDNCGFEGVNILNACGECSGQSVMHTHFHILPRKFNDGYKVWPEKNKENFDLLKIKTQLEIK